MVAFWGRLSIYPKANPTNSGRGAYICVLPPKSAGKKGRRSDLFGRPAKSLQLFAAPSKSSGAMKNATEALDLEALSISWTFRGGRASVGSSREETRNQK